MPAGHRQPRSSAAWGSPPTAQASASRHTAANGLIVFQAHVGRYNQLFTIKPDGSGLEQITKIPFTGDTDGAEQAAWSPDGKTIAFDAPSGKGGDTFINVFTVAPGRQRTRRAATRRARLQRSPVLLAGRHQDRVRPGRRILPAHGARDLRRQCRRQQSPPAGDGLATTDAYDTNTDWSPDGTRNSFTRVKNEREAAIFVVRADGRGLKRLTPWRLDAANPDWSPDGSKLLFHSYYNVQPGKSPNTFTIRPDGKRMTALTHFTGGDTQALGPSWSPDGTKIVWHKLSSDGQPVVRDGRARRPPAQADEAPAGAKPSHADWGTAAA